ncbi:MAG: hypothetical protein M5T52_03745 [Ignavibacteriaceae bacterium]|nr:hypothetical protein [Ignavibacteriaceae bacterium]
MEWGYALLKKNSTAPIDGCYVVSIKNSTITLNKSNTATGEYMEPIILLHHRLVLLLPIRLM